MTVEMISRTISTKIVRPSCDSNLRPMTAVNRATERTVAVYFCNQTCVVVMHKNDRFASLLPGPTMFNQIIQSDRHA